MCATRTIFALFTLALPGVATAREPIVPPGAAHIDRATDDPARIVDAFHDALAAGRVDTAASLLAEDALIVESGGAERTRAEYVAHHLAADVAFAAQVTRSVVRRTNGRSGKLAWVATESHSAGSFKGKAVDVNSTETAVLKREGGRWRLVHLHWSSAR